MNWKIKNTTFLSPKPGQRFLSQITPRTNSKLNYSIYNIAAQISPVHEPVINTVSATLGTPAESSAKSI